MGGDGSAFNELRERTRRMDVIKKQGDERDMALHLSLQGLEIIEVIGSPVRAL